MNQDSESAQPGERWLVHLQPVDAVQDESHEATVKLIDFDPRTQTWSVEQEAAGGTPVAVLAKFLIRKLG